MPPACVRGEQLMGTEDPAAGGLCECRRTQPGAVFLFDLKMKENEQKLAGTRLKLEITLT